jgi:hypothetical protein
MNILVINLMIEEGFIQGRESYRAVFIRMVE